MNIHPKTSASAIGGSLGLLIVTVLGSFHGIHLTAAADAAIPMFLSTLGAWLAPSPTDPPIPVASVPVSAPAPPRPTPPAPPVSPAP